MRVIIVEDEIKIRTGLSKLISARSGHSVVGEARNGKEGLELIRRLHPELVISDIRMPGMDGLEMLEEMKRQGLRCHCVILSGYSEFEYAQRALRFGVDDYLLKPLGPEEVFSMLDKIQTVITQEEEQKSETAEGILRNMILGGREPSQREVQLLKRSGNFTEEGKYYLLAGYLGDSSASYVKHLTEALEKMKELFSDRIYYVIIESMQQIYCLVQSEEPPELVEERLQSRLYRKKEAGDLPAWAFHAMENLEQLPDTGKLLREWQLLGMCVGYETLITKKIVGEISFAPYEYPRQAEQELKQALCGNSSVHLRLAAAVFEDTVRKAGWEPREYRRAYGKALHCIENLLQELDGGAYKAVQSVDAEKVLAGAVTLGQMERCFSQVVELAAEMRDKKEDIRNYVILKAINYIKEHYKENISLEQVAQYLELTPEYLSTLFNREVGINFTTFLKRFRISQAKRLLRGSDMKIYEIALETGYRDPKYFNRVFKEETGFSPGDYRQQPGG